MFISISIIILNRTYEHGVAVGNNFKNSFV